MKHVPTEEMFSGWSAFFASQTSKDDHRSSQRLRNHWVVHLDPAKIARCHFLDVTLWGVTFKSTKLYENLGVYIQIKMLEHNLVAQPILTRFPESLFFQWDLVI